MTVHHIGYLVKKLDRAAASFEALGYERVGESCHDEIRGVDILFLRKDGYTVELVSPYTSESVVSGLIKTYKNAPYHICYEAAAFESTLATLEADGYTRMDEPTPAPAIGGRRVCFLYSARIGMIELLEGEA